MCVRVHVCVCVCLERAYGAIATQISSIERALPHGRVLDEACVYQPLVADARDLARVWTRSSGASPPSPPTPPSATPSKLLEWASACDRLVQKDDKGKDKLSARTEAERGAAMRAAEQAGGEARVESGTLTIDPSVGKVYVCGGDCQVNAMVGVGR